MHPSRLCPRSISTSSSRLTDVPDVLLNVAAAPYFSLQVGRGLSLNSHDQHLTGVISLMTRKICVSFVIFPLLILSGCATSKGGVGNSAAVDAPAAQQAPPSTSVAAEGSASGSAISPSTLRDGIITKLDTIYFAFDSHLLSEAGRKSLQDIAPVLSVDPQIKLTIAGHCDERGSNSYNLSLGDKRASAIRNYLLSLGVAAERLETVSFGEERPADPGYDETAWAKNRRGEFLPAN
ncbi:MAG TPA: peptidoglycan-associated lipoprotein [Desulfuromonas sp.]|nr:peptidoglycan-associated lipoprotein [Desulfuromonas sp.]